MKGTFHGITSIILVFISFIIGVYAIFLQSTTFAIIYGAAILIGSLIIIQVFCTKCPCKETNCAHFFPGLVAKLLPKREEGNYKKREIVMVVLIVIVLLAFPQKWLYQKGDLIILFWLLMITGFYQIVRFVCRNCENKFCPGNTKKHEAK